MSKPFRWCLAVLIAGTFGLCGFGLPIGPGFSVDIGGALVPVGLGLIALAFLRRDLVGVVVSLVVMIIACHFLSRISSGGVEVNMLAVAILGAVLGAAASDDLAPVAAFVITTLGVAVGADLLSVQVIPLGTVANMGGAGTSDVVLLAGPLAAIFAAAIASCARDERW